MRIVHQSQQRLVLREWPILYWVNAVILGFLGVVIFLDEGLTGLSGALLGFALLLAFGPGITTVTFDVTERRFSLLRRRIWGRRLIEYPLSDIVDVQIHSPARRMVFLNLCLVGDQTLTLAEAGFGGGDFAQTAEIMRSYLQRDA